MLAVLQELMYESLRDGAVWPFDRRYIRPRHFHGQLECLLVLRGTATLHLGTRAEQVRAGQLCWVLPGVPHVMGDFSADFDMWVVELDSALVNSCWRTLHGAGLHDADARHEATNGGPHEGPYERWSVSLGERLAGRAIVDIGGEQLRPLAELAVQVWTSTDTAHASRLLAALCTLAFKVTLASVRARRAASIGELVSCLLLASPELDRRGTAAELGVSEGFLSRKIHGDLGVTFVEHRAHTRVAHFLALSGDGRRNLLAAALDAGFGSYSQFHRIFTRLSGSRPRDYLDDGRQRRALLVSGDRGDELRDRQRAPF